MKFQPIARGKRVVAARATVILPGGGSEKAKTDRAGLTTEFEKSGRHGVQLRYTEAKGGEHDGKKYDEVRRDPTPVVGVPAT